MIMPFLALVQAVPRRQTSYRRNLFLKQRTLSRHLHTSIVFALTIPAAHHTQVIPPYWSTLATSRPHTLTPNLHIISPHTNK